MAVSDLVDKTPEQVDGITPGTTVLNSRSYLDTYVFQRLIDLANSVAGTGSGFGYNVRSYGAVGDGVTDDTVAIEAAITAAGDGGTVFFPKGEYYITDTLTFKNAMTWIGEGKIIQTSVSYSVARLVYANQADTRLYDLYLNTSDDIREFFSGDAIELSGFSNSETNSLFEVYSVDNNNKIIRIIHYNATGTGDQEEDPADPPNTQCALDKFRGGSALRFRSLDGNNTVSKHFMEGTSLDNVSLRDMAFIGPGVNEAGGGGIRFYRSSENLALTGYYFNEISLTFVPVDGIRIEGPINSKFSNMRIQKIGFDAFVCNPSQYGGSTTSCHFSNIYMNSARRGLVVQQGVYLVFDALVFEGVSVGMFFNWVTAFTVNSCASETIKMKKRAGGHGVTLLMYNCYGYAINAMAVYYNTEISGWAKAAIMMYGTGRADTGGVINGNRYHPSIAQRRAVLGHSWSSTTPVLYIDDTEATIVADNWKVGRMIVCDGISDSDLGHRRLISDIDSETISSFDYTDTSDPTVNEDSGSGYSVGETWHNTSSGDRFKCFDNSVGAAVWKKDTAYALVSLEGRISKSTSLTTETGSEAVKVGRNYGADLVTKNVYRILETQQTGANALTLWLDVQDRIPEVFIHTIDFGSGVPDQYDGDFKLEKLDIVDLGGTLYLEATFNGNGSELDDFPNWTIGDQAAAVSSKITVDTQGFTENFVPSRIDYDEPTRELRFYFAESEFITTSNDIEIFGTMDSRMEEIDGVAVATALWEVSQVSSAKGQQYLPSLKVTVTTTNTVTVQSRTEDFGFYALEGFDYQNEIGVGFKGGNEVRIFDPQNTLGSGIVRSGYRDVPNGTSTRTITIKDARTYVYFASIDQNTNCWVDNIDEDSFQLNRQSGTGAQTFYWWAVKKKDLGYLLARTGEFFVT